MKEICSQNTCCGCQVCANICPKQAITMSTTEKGFYFPIINESLCVDCGLCKKTCPSLNANPINEPIKIFACKNKNENIRKTSSSGGTFQELSSLILNNNGSVYGVGFSKEHTVEHQRATSQNELEGLKGSKYVQSNTKNIFQDVLKDLKNGKEVLFSGTPCQVQALKNISKANQDNLFLIDVVCHGVPSPKIFEDYKSYLEKTYNSKIIKINFRHKENNRVQNMKIDFENGESYISAIETGDYFYSLFLKDFILMEKCYSCNYKSFSRVSDISLADFWGYDKGIAKNFGDKKGVSLVLINTQKGLDLFDKIKNNLHYLEVQKEDCYPYNCFSNFKMPEVYNELWEEYLKNGFSSIIDKYIKN